MKEYRRNFTWQEWLQAARDHGPSTTSGSNPGNDPDNGSAWAGGSFNNAVELAEHGWDDAVTQVEELLRSINTDIGEEHTTTFTSTYDVSGSEVDMGRFLSGEPECMVESVPLKVMRTGRVIKLIVPGSISARVHQDTIMRRGAAVMALVDAFSRMQHPVEVWLGFAVQSYGNWKARNLYMIQVQESDQPLNMGRIMFALAHPSSLRQLCFSVNEDEPLEIREKFGYGYGGHSGYGRPSYAVTAEDANLNVENTIVLPVLDYGETWTKDFATNWIETQLKRITEG